MSNPTESFQISDKPHGNSVWLLLKIQKKGDLMMNIKKYCEQNGLDPERVFPMALARGAGILPTVTAFTSYMTEIKDDCIVCTNEKLKVFHKEIPFSSFQSAEFGIGSGQLWLQCVVDGDDFIFCAPRKSWKSPAAKLLLQKIGEKTEILSMKEYGQYTGKLFFIYMFK